MKISRNLLREGFLLMARFNSLLERKDYLRLIRLRHIGSNAGFTAFTGSEIKLNKYIYILHEKNSIIVKKKCINLVSMFSYSSCISQVVKCNWPVQIVTIKLLPSIYKSIFFTIKLLLRHLALVAKLQIYFLGILCYIGA